MRKQTLKALKHLENGLETYFQKPTPDQLFGKLVNVELWYRHQQLLSNSPLIPSCAVDEWGFIDESNVLPTKELVAIRGLALQKYKIFLIYFGDYIRYFSNFFNQSNHAMVLNSIRGKCIVNEFGKLKSEQKAIENGFKTDFIRLSRINLSESVKVMPAFQRKFRQTFGQFFETPILDDLETQELTTFHSVWCMWYFFNINPNLTLRKPKKECVKIVDKMINDIKKTIQKDLSNISSKDLLISVASYDLFWGDKPALWISVDGKNGIDVYNSVEKIFPEIFRSINCFTDKELGRLIFEINWPLIIIVPKIQGKCLTDKAWRIDSNTLLLGTDEGILSWRNFATQYPIHRDALADLNIDIWDIPHLEIASKFAQNIVKLSLQLASIKDLERLPELDDQGISQIKTYVQKLMDDISIVIQNILESISNMTNIFGGLSPSDYYNRPNMIESMRALIELGKYIIPASNSQGEITLEPKTILEWANKLDEWRNYSMIAYLFWASDVIDNENKEKTYPLQVKRKTLIFNSMYFFL